MIYRSAGLVLVALALIALPSPAQSAAAPSTTKAKVVLTKLGPLVYPQIARTANISGDVKIALAIKPDGTVESARVVSGPPMLIKAALESARQSKFECRECTSGVTSSRVVYSFELTGRDHCCYTSSDPRVSRSGNHVTITDQAVCLCDPPAIPGKRRSWKCLYLWRCAR